MNNYRVERLFNFAINFLKVESKNTPNIKETDKQHQHHASGTKKQKRFVFSESSLVQQLNDLKQKIKA